MTRVLIVRHGQSEWNAVGRWQGQADPPLTDLGRAQAQAAVERLRGFDRIASSDLRRSLDTAEIIRAGIGLPAVHVDADLRERDAGAWTGLTRSDIDEGWPGFLANGDRPTGYETDDLLRRRVLAATERVSADLDGGRVAVIAHAGVIYALEAHAGLGHERVPNLGGRWFEIDGTDIAAGERVLLIDPGCVEATRPDQI